MQTLAEPCASVQHLPEAISPTLSRWLALVREAHVRSGSNVQFACVRSLAEVLHTASGPNSGVSWFCNSTLGNVAGMKTSTVQRVLRMLEAQGLVKRYEGNTAVWTVRAHGGTLPDGRYRVVCLTPWRYRLAHTRAQAEAMLQEKSRGVSFRKGRVLSFETIGVSGTDRTPFQGGAGVASRSPALGTKQQSRKERLRELQREAAELSRARRTQWEQEQAKLAELHSEQLERERLERETAGKERLEREERERLERAREHARAFSAQLRGEVNPAHVARMEMLRAQAKALAAVYKDEEQG